MVRAAAPNDRSRCRRAAWRCAKRPATARERLAYLEVCLAQFRCGAPRASNHLRRVVHLHSLPTTAGGAVCPWISAGLAAQELWMGSSQRTHCAVCNASLAAHGAQLHLLNPYAQLWAVHCAGCSLAAAPTHATAL